MRMSNHVQYLVGSYPSQKKTLIRSVISKKYLKNLGKNLTMMAMSYY
jgi:hypothetical protein